MGRGGKVTFNAAMLHTLLTMLQTKPPHSSRIMLLATTQIAPGPEPAALAPASRGGGTFEGTAARALRLRETCVCAVAAAANAGAGLA